MSVFTVDFSKNHSGSIICETSSPLLMLVFEWLERSYISKKKSRKFFIIAVDFWVHRKRDEKNTAEHVIMKKIFIYARACVSKKIVHSGSIGIYRAITRTHDVINKDSAVLSTNQ